MHYISSSFGESTRTLLQTYKLLTVTYGTTPAPYMAIRVLLDLATRYEEQFPQAATIVRQNRYVDHFLFDGHSVEEATRLPQQLLELLSKANIELGKWAVNKAELQPESSANLPIHLDKEDDHVSTLGLHWNPAEDCFSFKVKPLTPAKLLTKRYILSEVSKLFDPLGWIGPYLIRAKVLLQDMWLIKIDWDEPLPDRIREQWIEIADKFREIEAIKIPRYLGSNTAPSVSLHGFSDTSQRAYAACIYVVTRDRGCVRSSLVIAKTKVAPVKTLSMPRLELCRAHLLTRLLNEVFTSLQEEHHLLLYCCTDARIVLQWLKEHPSKWTTFVATRTSAISTLVLSALWSYVPSAENPADIATRGS